VRARGNISKYRTNKTSPKISHSSHTAMSQTGQNQPNNRIKNLISTPSPMNSLKSDLGPETGNNELAQTRISVRNSGALESRAILKLYFEIK